MSNSRVAGRIFFKVDGQQYSVGASVTYNLGKAKRETGSTSDHEHYYKEKPQVPYVSGELLDRNSVDVAKFLELDEVTVTLEIANGKIITFRDAWQSGEGEVNAEEGMIGFKFEAKSAEEVPNV